MPASCTQASPGQIEALEGTAWDAVLVDYHLPGVAFPALVAALGKRLPDVPVILVSGSIGEEKAVDLLKSGIADFVLKDRLGRLVPAIERALAEAAERRARRSPNADWAKANRACWRFSKARTLPASGISTVDRSR